jgi:hypothetical protein
MYAVIYAFCGVLRDRYLEKQQAEKIETEVRDVDRIKIRKVYACCPGWPSGGAIRALQSDIKTIYAPVIYTAPCVIVLMRADTLRGEVGAGGWRWKSRVFGPLK